MTLRSPKRPYETLRGPKRLRPYKTMRPKETGRDLTRLYEVLQDIQRVTLNPSSAVNACLKVHQGLQMD